MSLRDLFVEIGVEVEDDPLKDLNDVMDDVKKSLNRIDAGGLSELERETKMVLDEFEDLSDEVDDTRKEVRRLDSEDLNGLERETKRANSGFDGLKQMVLGVVAAIAAIGVINFAKDFATESIQAAASAQAIEAQFEQVFGEMEDTARATLRELGNDFGMLPSRLQPPFAQMTSMFKGLGYDTKGASEMAADGLKLVADAAAFYDMAFEDANSAFNSFIKGNYEGGEVIGLFANETQMAAFASDKLNMNWKKLDEAGKQLVRLNYAQMMQEAAGATGQAARESEGYENVMGNLNQAWVDLQAQAGEEFLPYVIEGIQMLTDKIVGFDPAPFVEGIFQAKDSIIAFKDDIISGYEAIEGFIEKYDWLLLALAGGVTDYYGITGAIFLYNQALLFAMGVGPVYTAVTGAMTAVTTAFGAAVAFVTSPVFLAAAAIAALIAIGVLLYKNWDTVKIKAGELKDWLGEKFTSIKSSITGALEPVVALFDRLMGKWDAFKDKVSSFSISGAVKKVAGFIPGFSSGIGRVPQDMVAEIHKDEAIIPAEQAQMLRDLGVIKGDGRYPDVSFDNLRGGEGSYQTTQNTNNSSTVHAPVTLIVQGGNTNEETGQSVREVIEDFFADLGAVMPQVREG